MFQTHGYLLILETVLILNVIHIGSCVSFQHESSLCSLSVWPMVFLATICIGVNIFVTMSYNSQVKSTLIVESSSVFALKKKNSESSKF